MCRSIRSVDPHCFCFNDAVRCEPLPKRERLPIFSRHGSLFNFLVGSVGNTDRRQFMIKFNQTATAAAGSKQSVPQHTHTHTHTHTHKTAAKRPTAIFWHLCVGLRDSWSRFTHHNRACAVRACRLASSIPPLACLRAPSSASRCCGLFPRVPAHS